MKGTKNMKAAAAASRAAWGVWAAVTAKTSRGGEGRWRQAGRGGMAATENKRGRRQAGVAQAAGVPLPQAYGDS